MRTVRETPEGPATKITVVDADGGLVLEQRVFDPAGRLVASSIARGHRQDPLSGLIMPSVVDIQCPAAEVSMRIELGNVRINRLSGDPVELWAMPRYPGVPAVDLCDPRVQPATAPSAATARRRR